MKPPLGRPYRLQIRWDSRDEPLVAEAARMATLLHNIASAAPGSADWALAIGSALERLSVSESVPQLLRAFELGRETWQYGDKEFTACKVLIVNSRVRPKRMQLTATCDAKPKASC
ncbi:MAG: hypothetical protein ABI627_05580 [Polyangiaceae bacterium]